MELNKVYNQDCLIGMKDIPDKYFELAIVDPPYGIGDFVMKSGSNKVNKRNYKNEIVWNSAAPREDYFSELQRVSQKRIIWGANYYNCFESGAIVWYKNIGHPNMSQCEIASLSFQKKVDFVQINWASGFYREVAEDKTIHPCQKPVKLYKWLLKHYATEGDKILDTHVGSGSSRIACHDMGFDFLGFELDKDYWLAQEKRFKEQTAQLKLAV